MGVWGMEDLAGWEIVGRYSGGTGMVSYAVRVGVCMRVAWLKGMWMVTWTALLVSCRREVCDFAVEFHVQISVRASCCENEQASKATNTLGSWCFGEKSMLGCKAVAQIPYGIYDFFYSI